MQRFPNPANLDFKALPLLQAGGENFALRSGGQGCGFLLFFYPRDDTPGLHQGSGIGFSEYLQAFWRMAGAVVSGVFSRDSVAKHDHFWSQNNGLTVSVAGGYRPVP